MLLPRPYEELLARVAFLYFVEKKGQIQIGQDSEVVRLYRWHLATKERAPQSQAPDAGLSQTTINRLAREARTLGVAAVSVDWSFAVLLKRDLALSDQLSESLGIECDVLFDAKEKKEASQQAPPSAEGPRRGAKAGSQAPAHPASSEDPVSKERRLILGLANYTAAGIERTWVAGDHVACGGGQTINWFARAVRRNPPRKRDLIFTPLSGRLWVEDWRMDDAADIMERPLDADDAVHILSESCETQKGGRFSQINQPLYWSTPDEAESIMRDHCAIGPRGTWNWDLPPASRAYLGVGSLDSDGHRLARFLARYQRRTVRDQQAYLDIAAPALIELRKVCGNLRPQVPLPGDLGNRLFPVIPLPSDQQAKDLKATSAALARIKKLVDGLNARAVVMTWEHLRRTRSVRVIAGGGTKLRALWTILLAASFDAQAARARRGDRGVAPMINELTTDRDTAVELMKAIRMLDADTSLRRQYHGICHELGLSNSPA